MEESTLELVGEVNLILEIVDIEGFKVSRVDIIAHSMGVVTVYPVDVI